jgi:hypothetical protein
LVNNGIERIQKSGNGIVTWQLKGRNNGAECFLCGPPKGYITRTNGTGSHSRQTVTLGHKVPWKSESRINMLARTSSNLAVSQKSELVADSCRRELVASQPPSNKDMSTEVEKYPLLGAVTRQRLVKIEDFICAAVTMICRVCRSVKRL